MNVEKTIEFLLEHQARAEVRMDRFDKRLDGITKLMRMGMKAMMATDKKVSALAIAQKRTDEKINTLIDAQQRTDEKINVLIDAQQRTDHALAATNKKFDRLIEALSKKGTNGRHN
jgi:septal ring factor EnvC (AmiA/AmiB activator)